MIQLVLSSLPLDEVPSHLALAVFFEDVRPLRGATSLIDWRLNGRLSDLILQGKLQGQFSESVIMPSQGRMAAREVLLFGLGSSGALTEERLNEGFSQLIRKLALLKSEDCVVSLGDLSKDFMGWRSLLRSFMGSLSQMKEDFQIVCTEDPKWISEAKKRNMDFGPDVHLSYA